MRSGLFAADMAGAIRILLRRIDSTPAEDALERKQAWIRLALLVLISSYAVIASLVVSPTRQIEPWAVAVLGYFACYTPVAVGLLHIVMRYPGHYPVRRLFSMANDFAGVAFAIVVGSVVMLPAYAMISG